MQSPLNATVTSFLDAQKHSKRIEIEALRQILLSLEIDLTENIKWNGPNYCHNGEDRITMRIQPPKQVQLIFHRGTKAQTQPKDRLIDDAQGLLDWRANDRAVLSFKNLEEIETQREYLQQIASDWLRAASV